MDNRLERKNEQRHNGNPKQTFLNFPFLFPIAEP